MSLRCISYLLPLALFVSCGSDTLEPAGASSAPAAATSPTVATRNAPTPPPVTGGGARIDFETDTIDFGDAWDTDELKGRFEFTNGGDEPLVIKEVKASCGCTTTELPKLRFEPGEGEAISLVWKPEGFGNQAKTFTVFSNSAGSTAKKLTVKAAIRPFARFVPHPLRLGELELGKRHTATATLSCVDPDFELLELISSHPLLTARELGPEPNGGKIVEVTLDENLPWGQFNSKIIARLRGRKEPGGVVLEHEVKLVVGASFFGDLRIQPSFFAVGRVIPEAPIRYQARMWSASGELFEVIEARVENSQPPGMTVRVEPSLEGGWQLYLEGESGDYRGLIRGQVVITTSLAGEGPRRLSVMGIVRE